MVLGGRREDGAVAELRRFTRWARSLGRSRAAADPEEAGQLRIGPGAVVYRARRLRTLSGAPVLVERTTYRGRWARRWRGTRTGICRKPWPSPCAVRPRARWAGGCGGQGASSKPSSSGRKCAKSGIVDCGSLA
ncbi:UTRA domain-containing protein [Streptomyces goshikiensis]|uniref:UTRA domain-containing protein n=1 Tax=Streptomyces goshikiensis TaxID=1942 RepID=UPI003722085A